ncbi:UTRA domain-containing protein [Sphingosinicella sp. LHD-64]|uniref:UTRA domain-containing protein n=1 Tax=Sphingosinicella sp. LHD-64 TaxID=3072139 RepID=UPI00280E18B0|nr:UTRA domain-containing protein [Sphingosinicella sp. LHD-64]MDQ8756683.1 UTRA domain-containing protein [Sphingosinicella sp. LHD-64]
MSKTTLEQRIRSDIEARIRSGALRPGDRIPFEHELVAAYGCARATVSKAVEALAKAGLVERRRKAGTFVAHPHVQSAVLAVPDLEKLIAARGEAYRWTLIEQCRASASDLETGDIPSPALRIDGVHHADGVPLALEMRLISLSAVPLAASQPFGERSPGAWLLEQVPWTEARHEIGAANPTPEEAAALDMPTSGACLEVRRWTWQSGAPVTYVRQLFPGGRYHLMAEFTPGA